MTFVGCYSTVTSYHCVTHSFESFFYCFTLIRCSIWHILLFSIGICTIMISVIYRIHIEKPRDVDFFYQSNHCCNFVPQIGVLLNWSVVELCRVYEYTIYNIYKEYNIFHKLNFVIKFTENIQKIWYYSY